MTSQVTTKSGDDGTTRTLGGETLSKSHPILEANGSLDSLRTRLARLRLMVVERNPAGAEAHAEFLWWLLHVCFVVGSEISDPLWKCHASHPGKVGPEHLVKLEKEQARLEASMDEGLRRAAATAPAAA